MLRRLMVVGCLVAFGLSLSGCSKCGFWLDEWLNKPTKSCAGDFPK